MRHRLGGGYLLDGKSKLWSRTYTLLFCTNFITWFGFSILLSTTPLFIRHMGAEQAQVGLVIGVYPLAALLSRPYAGYAYDTLGRKKVFLVSLFFFAVITFIYPLVTSLLALVLIRIVHGLFFGVATTGAGTIVADIVPPDKVGRGVGYFGLGNTLSHALGPVIGIWIMNSFGFATVFIASGSVMTISFLMALFVSYPQRVAQKKALSIANMIEKRVLPVACLNVIHGSITGAIMTYVIVFSREIGLANGGLYFTLSAAGVAISRMLTGRFLDKYGPRWIMTFGFCLKIIGLILLSSSRTMTTYGLAAFILGSANGITMPSMQAMIINMVPASRRGAATATHLTALDLGISGGAIVLGWVAGQTSLPAMFLICAVMVLLPITLFNFYVIKDYHAKSAQMSQQALTAEG